ncbi:MAG: type IV toxin-antitoxin system AbiEi family antitoxin [Desulfosalsimonas sp.]
MHPEKNQPEAVLQIYAPEAKTKKYYPEIKEEITRATLLGYMAERAGRPDRPGILVAWYVNPQMAERLKEKDIAFIDAAGNAYINDPPVYIYITGRRKRHIPEKTTVGRAFKPAGLKVVFALLCQPELVKAEWWKNVNQQNIGALLGGEPAAAFLTDYLKPAAVTVYVPEAINQFLLAHHLSKAPDGDVELFQKFWNFDYQWDYKNIVPPMLVYADLVAADNDRHIETAKMIYGKYIHRFIEKL